MSIAIEPAVHASRLAPFLDWLRHARVALSLPTTGLEELSDRSLADIGPVQPDMISAVDNGAERLGLLALGWRQPRRPMRR